MRKFCTGHLCLASVGESLFCDDVPIGLVDHADGLFLLCINGKTSHGFRWHYSKDSVQAFNASLLFIRGVLFAWVFVADFFRILFDLSSGSRFGNGRELTYCISMHVISKYCSDTFFAMVGTKPAGVSRLEITADLANTRHPKRKLSAGSCRALDFVVIARGFEPKQIDRADDSPNQNSQQIALIKW